MKGDSCWWALYFVLSCSAFYCYFLCARMTFKPTSVNVWKKPSLCSYHRYYFLSLIHISEPTRPLYISYAVFCLKKSITKSSKVKRKQILNSKSVARRLMSFREVRASSLTVYRKSTDFQHPILRKAKFRVGTGWKRAWMTYWRSYNFPNPPPKVSSTPRNLWSTRNQIRFVNNARKQFERQSRSQFRVWRE